MTTNAQRYKKELAKYAARRDAMKAMRANGKTLQQIADKFGGISRQRVSNILKEAA